MPTAAQPFVTRLTHWINALAILCMIGSGWTIYNASPLFSFQFPHALILGGWLGGALAIHFAMMWLLTGNFLLYVVHGLASGGLRRRLLPVSPAKVWRDMRLALSFRLPHAPGIYNAVQRLLYILVLLAIGLAIVSGLALWKPVQLYWLGIAMGGYEALRREHFLAMAGIVGFLIVHVMLVAIVPRTLLPMLTGRIAGSSHQQDAIP
jgi:thiosulfate reductase cytochrome b subunit